MTLFLKAFPRTHNWVHVPCQAFFQWLCLWLLFLALGWEVPFLQAPLVIVVLTETHGKKWPSLHGPQVYYHGRSSNWSNLSQASLMADKRTLPAAEPNEQGNAPEDRWLPPNYKATSLKNLRVIERYWHRYN